MLTNEQEALLARAHQLLPTLAPDIPIPAQDLRDIAALIAGFVSVLQKGKEHEGAAWVLAIYMLGYKAGKGD